MYLMSDFGSPYRRCYDTFERKNYTNKKYFKLSVE